MLASILHRVALPKNSYISKKKLLDFTHSFPKAYLTVKQDETMVSIENKKGVSSWYYL